MTREPSEVKLHLSESRVQTSLDALQINGASGYMSELGIEPIWCHPDELWAINSLALSPGRVLMCDRYPYTAELLERRGVEVVRIPYDEIQKNGGGIHCSTMELIREDV